MVDDPFVFGQIAAVNALNDVYAMGGEPLLAMNIVCFPQCEDLMLLREILLGGQDKINEAGALLVGGHTVDDMEPKFGLSVTGLVHPEKIISNGGARPGDLLFLTKPLGSGIIATAIKAEMADPGPYGEAVGWMRLLNRDAARVMQEMEVKAATDVTGFGLLGHVYELARASGVGVEIVAGQVPLMAGAWDYSSMGLVPGGAYSNRDYLEDQVEYSGEINPVQREILFSPETAGGLLIAVKENRAKAFTAAMDHRDIYCRLIGRVVAPGAKAITIKA